MRSNQSILKEISPGCSLEGLMLKLKLHFGHLMQRTDSLEKTLMLGKIEGRRRRRREDEMVGWHRWLNGHEFEQAPGDGDGQGSLTCCSLRGPKESDTTERLNWTEQNVNQHSVTKYVPCWANSPKGTGTQVCSKSLQQLRRKAGVSDLFKQLYWDASPITIKFKGYN